MCIRDRLGGGLLNAKTVARALEAEARVYASYGMTEKMCIRDRRLGDRRCG